METILQPVISKIESLKVSLKTCQEEKQLRAKLLLSVFDSCKSSSCQYDAVQWKVWLSILSG